MHYKTYLITSEDTDKQYIGITKNTLNYRLKQHFRSAKNGSPLALHRSIRKFGLGSFSIELISDCMSESQAKEEEQRLIFERKTMAPSGYNMTPGGDGCVDLSPEARERQKESVRLRHADPEFKERHREGCKLSYTQERKDKISRAHSGKGMHPNAMAGILEAKKTPEYREKASRVAKEKWKEPGYKEKWVDRKKAKHIEKASRFPVRSDGAIFSSTRSAANYMQSEGWEKAAPNNICMACNGKYKTSCGYSWDWIDGDEARAIGGII